MGDIHVMREDLLPPKQPPRRHLISIGDLTRDDVERLLATARSFDRSLEREMKKLPTLRGHTVVNVFYESSTRTSSSFELAAKRLSADTMSIKAAGSSVDKGESLKDTALTLGAYDPDVIVLRHPQIGAPLLVARYTEAHIVNAGDGKHQHPTQALLDLYTIREEVGPLEGLHVAIVGDVLHSRVARSNIQALTLMGAHVTLVGPPPLIPRGIEAMGCESRTTSARSPPPTSSTSCACSASGCRRARTTCPRLREYTARWGVTPERLRPGQKVMHPGPMNRGVEIDPRVADAADALIETQVRAGPRRADGGALRPAHARPGLGAIAASRWRWRDAVRARTSPTDDLVVRGARVARPGRGNRRGAATSASTPARSPQLGTELDANEHRVVDGAGLLLAPAFVDPHVHLRTPGREDEETIASGTAAAAAGGYCAILAMPNTDPVIDSAAVLGSLIEAAQAEAEIPVGFLAAITRARRARS